MIDTFIGALGPEKGLVFRCDRPLGDGRLAFEGGEAKLPRHHRHIPAIYRFVSRTEHLCNTMPRNPTC